MEMADISTEQMIVDYLNQCQGNSATLSDFCNSISVQKRSLVKHLRELKRNKQVSENRKTTPPTWSLCQQTNLPSTPAASNTDNLRERVLKYLHQQKVPRTAIEVAKNLGLRNKKSVNPILYRLEKDQVLVTNSTQGRKPLWQLSDKARAMAEEQGLFRDSSKDSDAPGAYSPEKNTRTAGKHSERQQHRLFQRNLSKPYDTDHGHHHRSMPGSGQGTSLPHAPASQAPIKQLDSGIMADREEDLRVTALSDGRYRQVAVVSSDHEHSDLTQVESTHGESSHNIHAGREHSDYAQVHTDPEKSSDTPNVHRQGDDDDKSDGDEDFEDDSGYDFEPPDMAERFQDMMGELVFPDMTYVEEVDEPEEDLALLPDDIVLIQLSLEPNQTATATRLAQALHKTEEEMTYVLGSCGDKVTVNSNLWSLTDKGIDWAREKSQAYPFLLQHLSSSEESSSHSRIAQVSASPSGPPPSPQALIAANPSFYMKGESGVGTEMFSTSKPPSKHLAGREVGKDGGAAVTTGDGENVWSGFGHMTSQPILTQPSFFQPLPPTAQDSPMTSTVSAAVAQPSSSSMAQIHPPDQRLVTMPTPTAVTFVGTGQAQVDRLSHERNSQPAAYPDTLIAGFQAHSQPQNVPRFQGQGQYASMPSAVLSAINPSLHKFAEEGLLVMSAPEARILMEQPAGCGFGETAMEHSGASTVEVLERQLGNAGITATNPLDGPTNRRSPQPSGSMVSTELPRSHSLPQLSSDSGTSSMGGEGPGSMLKITSESFAALNKNPISALMEYAQSRRLQAVIEVVSQRGPSHRPVFLMAARVGNRQFPGVTCHNKKDGRKEAADVALRTLIAEGQYSAAAPTPSINIAPEEMTHFDKIAALTHQTFNSLIATIPENLAGRKVIAGLVMKRSEDDVGIVISIGTGNRCITGDKLSLEGNTVNDSHAEIITRRGFMRFLYQQLEKYEPGQPHELLEPGSSGRLKVKDGITFHLYISTAPCGDGALFSPRDVESNSAELADVERREHHPTFTSNVQGLLRTKMEGGEGTIPVDTKDVTMQTWDGVVRGERLRTMSCTDKICRWNVLGLQGALLSHFVEPVYLDSLTLGFLYDHGHLSRAVCCRLAKEDPQLAPDLPQGFRLNHPWLGRVTACQPLRETQKTKAFSINWTVGDQKAEVLDGTLGHCYTAVEKRLCSRLAKRSLYDSFKAVAQHLGRTDLLQAPTYHHNKAAARSFQEAKAAMVKKFQQMGCGWVKKPVEEEMFS